MKKVLGVLAAVAMMAYMAAPAMAAYNVWVVNNNLVGVRFLTFGALSWSGDEDVSSTGGSVEITNTNTDASADVVDDVNVNDTDIGEAGANSYNVLVENNNVVVANDSLVSSLASSGDDSVTDTGGNVTLVNGSATSYAGGFLVTNSNITRVR